MYGDCGVGVAGVATGGPFFSGTGNVEGGGSAGCWGCGEYPGDAGLLVVGVGAGTEAGAGVELGVCVKAVEAALRVSAAKERKPLVRTRTSIPVTQLLAPV